MHIFFSWFLQELSSHSQQFCSLFECLDCIYGISSLCQFTTTMGLARVIKANDSACICYYYRPSNHNEIISIIIYNTHIDVNKTFRERQHPRPAKIRKYKLWLSVAISNSDPLHGSLHHATKFQVVMWFPHISWYGSSSWSKPIIKKFKKVPWTRKNWPGIGILNSDLLHCTVQDPTKLQADSWNPQRVTAVKYSLRPGPSLSWKMSRSHGTRKSCPSRTILKVICVMVLCIFPPNSRPIAEILKVLER